MLVANLLTSGARFGETGAAQFLPEPSRAAVSPTEPGAMGNVGRGHWVLGEAPWKTGSGLKFPLTSLAGSVSQGPVSTLGTRLLHNQVASRRSKMAWPSRALVGQK